MGPYLGARGVTNHTQTEKLKSTYHLLDTLLIDFLSPKLARPTSCQLVIIDRALAHLLARERSCHDLARRTQWLLGVERQRSQWRRRWHVHPRRRFGQEGFKRMRGAYPIAQEWFFRTQKPREYRLQNRAMVQRYTRTLAAPGPWRNHEGRYTHTVGGCQQW